MLRHIRRRAAVFTPDRQALCQSQRHQEDRRPESGVFVGREQPDDERREAHDHHGDQERTLASDTVAQRPKHQRAKGPYRKARAERGETGKEGRCFVAGRKEQGAEEDGETAVQEEVVPFEDGPK